MKPDYLRLRGAADILRKTRDHIESNPFEPNWFVDYEHQGFADSTITAIRIIQQAIRTVERDLEKL